MVSSTTSNSTHFLVNFNETIYVDASWSKDDWNLWVEGPLSNYELEWSLPDEAGVKFPNTGKFFEVQYSSGS